MNLRAPFSVLALLAILALGAGCVDDPTAGTPAPTVRADAALIAPGALASFVPPAPPGWQLLAPPSPATLEEDGVSLVSVTASYLPADDPNGTGNRSADLTIQDTGGRSVGLRKLADLLSSAPKDGSGLTRTTLRGQPASVLGDETMTGAYLVVADRYVVYLAVTGGTRADFDAFVAALDLEGLAGQR